MVQTVSASRPSSVSANAEPLRNGMTAIGSHEYFYSLRGAQTPGEGIPQQNQAPAFRGKAILRKPHIFNPFHTI